MAAVACDLPALLQEQPGGDGNAYPPPAAAAGASAPARTDNTGMTAANDFAPPSGQGRGAVGGEPTASKKQGQQQTQEQTQEQEQEQEAPAAALACCAATAWRSSRGESRGLQVQQPASSGRAAAEASLSRLEAPPQQAGDEQVAEAAAGSGAPRLSLRSACKLPGVYDRKTGPRRFDARVTVTNMPASHGSTQLIFCACASAGEAAVLRDLAVLWRRMHGREPRKAKAFEFVCPPARYLSDAELMQQLQQTETSDQLQALAWQLRDSGKLKQLAGQRQQEAGGLEVPEREGAEQVLPAQQQQGQQQGDAKRDHGKEEGEQQLQRGRPNRRKQQVPSRHIAAAEALRLAPAAATAAAAAAAAVPSAPAGGSSTSGSAGDTARGSRRCRASPATASAEAGLPKGVSCLVSGRGVPLFKTSFQLLDQDGVPKQGHLPLCYTAEQAAALRDIGLLWRSLHGMDGGRIRPVSLHFSVARYEAERTLKQQLEQANTELLFQNFARQVLCNGELEALVHRLRDNGTAARPRGSCDGPGGKLAAALPLGGPATAGAGADRTRKRQRQEQQQDQDQGSRRGGRAAKRVRTAPPCAAVAAAAVPLTLADPVTAGTGSPSVAGGSRMQLAQQMVAAASQPGGTAAGITPQLIGSYIVMQQEREWEQAEILLMLLAQPDMWPAAAIVMQASAAAGRRAA